MKNQGEGEKGRGGVYQLFGQRGSGLWGSCSYRISSHHKQENAIKPKGAKIKRRKKEMIDWTGKREKALSSPTKRRDAVVQLEGGREKRVG